MDRRQDAETLRDSELLRAVIAERAMLLHDEWETARSLPAREDCWHGIVQLRLLEELIDDRVAAALAGDGREPDPDPGP